jgi:hypothetical protein
MAKKGLDEMTTIRVKRRTQHAVNTIAGLLAKGTTADDVVWDALRKQYPEQMAKIEDLQRMSPYEGDEE